MSTEPNTALTDISLVCNDCKEPFIHTVADQERYLEKGFAHQPKRCPTCREKRRTEKAAKQAPKPAAPPPERRPRPERPAGQRSFSRGDSAPPGRRFGFRGPPPRGGAGPSGPRTEYPARCAACGTETTVPFKPTEGRPVYCRDCYRNKRTAGDR